MVLIKDIVKNNNHHQYTEEEYQAAQKLQDKKNAQAMHADHECPICHGVGRVRRNDDSGLTDLCDCVRLLDFPYDDRRGITKDEAETLHLDKILELNDNGPAIKAIKVALQDGHGWIYLYGGYGLGKTWTLKSTVASALQANKEAVYLRMSTAVNLLNEALDPQAPEKESAIMNWLVHLPVLALDEVDKIRQTDYRIEKRFELLDSRYERACKEKIYSVTIMAGNESPDKLEGYLADRMRDGRFKVVELKGISLRPGMDY